MIYRFFLVPTSGVVGIAFFRQSAGKIIIAGSKQIRMKKKAPKGWVKISDFEETTGISAKTITAAIKRGYIPDNFADVVGTSATSPYYLNPQQAAVCWYKSLNSAHPNQRKVRNALAGYIKTFDKAVIEPEPTAKAVATATMTYEDAQLQEKSPKPGSPSWNYRKKRVRWCRASA